MLRSTDCNTSNPQQMECSVPVDLTRDRNKESIYIHESALAGCGHLSQRGDVNSCLYIYTSGGKTLLSRVVRQSGRAFAVQLGLYKILFCFWDFVHESILFVG